jgi:hypothetical protein
MIHLFDDIDASGMTDPVVQIHLVSGRVFAIQDVSIIELGKRLNKYGFVFFSDGAGDYGVLFQHGVAALLTAKDTDA